MRLFIAIDIPEELKEYFADIQGGIGNDLAKINFVKKENIHITLKFLGEVKEENINKIKEILANIKFEPFSLLINKLGVFPNESYIRVIWIGFKDPEKLFDLHKLIDMSLSKLFSMEKKFLGHLTLARVKFVKDKKQLIEKLKSIKIEEKEFNVNSFKLYKSTLTKQGPIYEVLEEYR